MSANATLISVVIPAFNEEESIAEVVRRLLGLRDSMAQDACLELIFVDDGSSDKTLSILKTFAAEHECVKIISFSRNFGHQIAITAGIDAAHGDFVALIDADLQDPPELIAQMHRLAMTGIDVVYGKRRSRASETWFKKLTAAAFYRILRYMCEIDIPSDTGDFRLMSRKVVDALKQMRERHRFVRGMVPWVGYKSCEFEYDRAERFAGTTKYPLRKMLSFSVNAILSFSSKPIRMAIKLGAFVIVVGFIGALYLLYLKLFTTIPVPGVTAILLSVIIFGGIQIFLIGVVGEYIARIFEESKKRPLYVVAESINL